MREKFSSGPWKVDPPIGAEHTEVRDNDGRRIAVVAGSYPMRAKTEDANAHLIAAAPEMYEILSHLEWIDDSDYHLPSCPCCRRHAKTHADDCKLHAALEKARGEI